jgi:chitodextrinase
MRYLLLCLTIFLIPMYAFAATDNFSVTFNVLDQAPPTTPTGLAIGAVTNSQINISWNASTDDGVVVGYQIFRDASAIATTTLTSYTDSGLTGSTTYSYQVRAFDQASKYSTTTGAVGTTTLGALVVSLSGEGSTASEIELLSLETDIDFTTAKLSWETDRFARYILQWGETLSYELGFVANQGYKKTHETLITDLEPNTTYEYRIVAENARGDRSVLVSDSFKTPALPDTTPPPNVSAFLGTSDKGDVELSWRNPDFDFSYVRIVRNPLFYPTDPFDGYVVYEGDKESYTDKGVIRDIDVLYYTAFVYDEAGNRSSGAIVWVRKWPEETAGGGGNGASVIQSTLEDKPADVVKPVVPFEPIRPTSTIMTDPLTISFDDIVIIQANETIESVDTTYLVDTTKPFTISAPYHIFPEHLKAIRVTLMHPVDDSETYSFLLRVNADKTAYEALITDLGFSGTIPMRLSVYDYETNEQASADASIISRNTEPAVEVVQNIGSGLKDFWWVPLPLLLLFILWLVGRLRDKDEDNPPVRFG